TDMCVVPTMANALINSPDRAKWDLSSLRRINIGGAANSPELVERVEAAFPGSLCLSGYGLTETAPVITFSHGVTDPVGDAERRRRQAMAGLAVPGVEIRVVDPNMNDVPRDMQAIGEVIARSDHVMDGYYCDEAATKAVMSDAWFHTGDMAVWEESGAI